MLPLAAILLGFVVRIALLLLTKGTNDIVNWETFANEGLRAGLPSLYPTFSGAEGTLLMNHPPLAGYLGVECARLAIFLSVPFYIVFKLVQVLSDVVLTLLIGAIAVAAGQSKKSALWGMAIYSLSPVSILISAYHGNTDSLCVLALVGGILCMQKRRFFIAGALVALACNIKLIPILAVPFLLVAIKRIGDLTSFIIGLLALLVPLVIFLIVTPSALHNVVGYGSNAEPWGLLLASLLLPVPLSLVRSFARNVALTGLMMAVGAAWYRYGKYALSLRPIEAVFISMSLFLLLAPGFGVQYCLYPLPGLILCAPQRAIAWSLATGAFLVTVYLKFIVSWSPVLGMHTGPFAFYDCVVLGIVSWLMLLVALRAQVLEMA